MSLLVSRREPKCLLLSEKGEERKAKVPRMEKVRFLFELLCVDSSHLTIRVHADTENVGGKSLSHNNSVEINSEAEAARGAPRGGFGSWVLVLQINAFYSPESTPCQGCP